MIMRARMQGGVLMRERRVKAQKSIEAIICG